MTIPGVIVMENTMRKEKRIFLILMIGICLSGMLIIKKTTVIRGQENTVSHVTAPKDIPAVAVEINKSSEVICDKLSEITYTVYTDSDTAYSGSVECFYCQYEAFGCLYCKGNIETASGI